MVFFPRRSDAPDIRFLEWKVRLFAIGAVLALAGIYLDARWMVGIAIGMLAAGFALRFVPKTDSGDEDEGERDDDVEG